MSIIGNSNIIIIFEPIEVGDIKPRFGSTLYIQTRLICAPNAVSLASIFS